MSEMEVEMARPKKCRKINAEPSYDCFTPDGFPSGVPIILTVDEFEVIRLVDLEGLTQAECAFEMEVARTTVTDMYDSARKKIAECIVTGRELKITGGNYRLSNSKHSYQERAVKDEAWGISVGEIKSKGEGQMRIAVTYENGEVFQHFGHTETFKIYDVEESKIIKEEVVGTNGQGHGALAGLLQSGNVDVLICGGIGGGAQNALKEAGIKLYGGVTGSADEAVKAFLNENLNYNPDVKCNHHGESSHVGEHSCGSHSHDGHNCGQHKCYEK